MSIPLAVANFFQNYFVAQKLARWRSIVTEKGTIDGYACKSLLLPEPDLHCVGPLVLWDFRNIFLPIQVKTKKILM